MVFTNTNYLTHPKPKSNRTIPTMNISIPDMPGSSPSPLTEAPSELYVDPYLERVKDRINTIKAAVSPGDSTQKKTGEHPIDIFSLNPEERKILLEGPKTSIIADGNIIIRKAVPLRALVASCTKVYDLFQIKPRATQFRVYGKVNQYSVEKLLDIFTTEEIVHTKTIKLDLPSLSFVDGVLMYQACLTLGIIYHHTKPLLTSLCAQISDRELTTEEMSTIVNRCPPQDPLFRHLANSLCHLRFKKQILDVAAFEHWLGKKPVLQKVMVGIDQAHKKRRAAIKERKISWRADSVLAKWGEEQKEEGKQ
ncbi:hypothetical protein J1614_005664 [Plenodomus biglobosus]|nr:hypothetical protein J1614_005664 [Plenodomus biglobosus]